MVENKNGFVVYTLQPKNGRTRTKETLNNW